MGKIRHIGWMFHTEKFHQNLMLAFLVWQHLTEVSAVDIKKTMHGYRLYSFKQINNFFKTCNILCIMPISVQLPRQWTWPWWSRSLELHSQLAPQCLLSFFIQLTDNVLINIVVRIGMVKARVPCLASQRALLHRQTSCILILKGLPVAG